MDALIVKEEDLSKIEENTGIETSNCEQGLEKMSRGCDENMKGEKINCMPKRMLLISGLDNDITGNVIEYVFSLGKLQTVCVKEII